MAHVKMIAVQPFLSGGISKTVNMPNSSTIGDIMFRWLSLMVEDRNGKTEKKPVTEDKLLSDNPACPRCGYITVKNGTCHKCVNCGESLGCS